jgi:uncharacterized protein (TIGR02145 family)
MRKILLILLIGGIGVLTNCGGDSGDLPCLLCPDSYYMPSSSSYPYDPWNPSSSSRQQSSSSREQSSSSSVNYTDKGNSISSYRKVTIGTQVWMAENLNYKVAGSKCYGEGSSSYSTSKVQSNCDKYGRLYDWSTAMGLASSCNSTTCSGQVSTKHRGICPSGWHIPSNEDWSTLINYVESSNGCSSCAGTHLKATSGWNSYSGIVNLDTHGFSALPGGYGSSGGNFYLVGNGGDWWGASEDDSNDAYSRDMYYNDEYAYWSGSSKYYLQSIRCLQD